jgi:hypothetical protein
MDKPFFAVAVPLTSGDQSILQEGSRSNSVRRPELARNDGFGLADTVLGWHARIGRSLFFTSCRALGLRATHRRNGGLVASAPLGDVERGVRPGEQSLAALRAVPACYADLTGLPERRCLSNSLERETAARPSLDDVTRIAFSTAVAA